MKKNLFETIIGFVVLICASMFLYFSLKISNTQIIHGYKVIAKFKNIEGITAGSDVKIGGIIVGSVVKQELDPETYEATITIEINKDVKLPSDTSIKISTSGLVGTKFVNLEPGADEEYLEEGDEVSFTQSTIDLEELLGKFVFNGKEKSDN